MDTLVLSPAYEPINRISWQDAITLLFQNKIEVVAEYENRQIHSISLTLNIPSIVRFLHHITGRKRGVKFSRQNIHLRDKGMCQYCGVKVPITSFTYDHVLPRAQGGKTEWNNVVVSCTPCNQKKGCRTPVVAGMKLRTTPTRPKSLPDTVRFCLMWREGMPEIWKDFMASYQYWNSELEE